MLLRSTNRTHLPPRLPQVSLWACRGAAPGNTTIYLSSWLDCMALCRQRGARVVNYSYGRYNSESQLEREAIQALGAAGGLFVTSAGNEGVDNDALPAGGRKLPASYNLDSMLAVAASVVSPLNGSDVLAAWSSSGR